MSADITPALSPWQRALRVAAVFAVAPCGVVLRAQAGPLRERWLAVVRELLPAATPWLSVPVNAPLSRLTGGLDLGATLSAGRPCLERGLLARADGGVLVISMAERMAEVCASTVAMAFDDNAITLERDGLSARIATRFVPIALDEGLDADEIPPTALRERAALLLDFSSIVTRKLDASPYDRAAIAVARGLWPQVTVSADLITALTAAAQEVGIRSLRPVLNAMHIARAVAALDGKLEVDEHHAALAAQWVLAPRAECMPAPPEAASDAPPPPSSSSSQSPPSASDEQQADKDLSQQDIEEAQQLVVAAAQAAIPDTLLRELEAGRAAQRAGSAGRAGARAESCTRGRPLAARAGKPGANARLNVIETLRAAAPWQRLRREQRAGFANTQTAAPRIEVRSSDFRVTRFQQRQQTLTIFVVDTSGSTAMQRLAEAKGAVELMLAECYVRRDKVALVAVGGRSAAVALAPTRALTRAKRCLAELPGGGGSPLASGVVLARDLALAARRDGATPVVVLLTDGRPNVSLAGIGGAEAASEDALAAARELSALGLAALMIDLAPRPREFAPRMAAVMGARYLALPGAGASTIAQLAQSLQSEARVRVRVR